MKTLQAQGGTHRDYGCSSANRFSVCPLAAMVLCIALLSACQQEAEKQADPVAPTAGIPASPAPAPTSPAPAPASPAPAPASPAPAPDSPAPAPDSPSPSLDDGPGALPSKGGESGGAPAEPNPCDSFVRCCNDAFDALGRLPSGASLDPDAARKACASMVKKALKGSEGEARLACTGLMTTFAKTVESMASVQGYTVPASCPGGNVAGQQVPDAPATAETEERPGKEEEAPQKKPAEPVEQAPQQPAATPRNLTVAKVFEAPDGSGPAGARQVLLVLGDTDRPNMQRLALFDLRSGRASWVVPWMGPVPKQVQFLESSLLLLCMPDTVFRLDLATGEPQGSWPIPPGTEDFAGDSRSLCIAFTNERTMTLLDMSTRQSNGPIAIQDPDSVHVAGNLVACRVRELGQETTRLLACSTGQKLRDWPDATIDRMVPDLDLGIPDQGRIWVFGDNLGPGGDLSLLAGENGQDVALPKGLKLPKGSWFLLGDRGLLYFARKIPSGLEVAFDRYDVAKDTMLPEWALPKVKGLKVYLGNTSFMYSGNETLLVVRPELCHALPGLFYCEEDSSTLFVQDSGGASFFDYKLSERDVSIDLLRSGNNWLLVYRRESHFDGPALLGVVRLDGQTLKAVAEAADLAANPKDYVAADFKDEGLCLVSLAEGNLVLQSMDPSSLQWRKVTSWTVPTEETPRGRIPLGLERSLLSCSEGRAVFGPLAGQFVAVALDSGAELWRVPRDLDKRDFPLDKASPAGSSGGPLSEK